MTPSSGFFFQAWENEQQMVRQELIDKNVINLNGDGRCDSLDTMPSMVLTH